jgi:DNA-binding LacI/PurR family transcriptional regulator
MTKDREAVLQILRRRIDHGDYLMRELPTERELASETGVSRMTARKALIELIRDGMLAREPNGRVAVRSAALGGLRRVAFLVPSLVSPDVEEWRLALDRIAASFKTTVRTVMYLHWDDPILHQALSTVDGVFLYCSAEPVPDSIIARMRSCGRPVVSIDQDLTVQGIPSVRLFPPSFVHRLLDEIATLGHASCDCFNIQTVDVVIEQRLAQWNLWRAHRRIPGALLGTPIAAFATPLAQAYAQMGRLLDAGGLTATALLCTTAPAAIGAIRAMHDRGIRVGSDVSVCVFNDEGLAPYVTPSLTSVRMPDPSPYLSVCLEWMQRGGEQWLGPMLLQPDQVTLFRGESTGPASTKQARHPAQER